MRWTLHRADADGSAWETIPTGLLNYLIEIQLACEMADS